MAGKRASSNTGEGDGILVFGAGLVLQAAACVAGVSSEVFESVDLDSLGRGICDKRVADEARLNELLRKMLNIRKASSKPLAISLKRP